MSAAFFIRPVPPALEQLRHLAGDLRWTWSHTADALWRNVDAASWERSENPWSILQDVGRERLEQLAVDPQFLAELGRLDDARQRYLRDPGWFGSAFPDRALRRVAYFCMEFGLAEALPLYAGGLGVLAGDFLKAASDLGVPLVGVGLLYQEGFFRQAVDELGRSEIRTPHTMPSATTDWAILRATSRRRRTSVAATPRGPPPSSRSTPSRPARLAPALPCYPPRPTAPAAR